MQNNPSLRLGLRLAYWLGVAAVFVLAVAPFAEGGPDGLDKVKHFAAFLVVALGGAAVYPRAPLWGVALAVIAYGGLIELIQALPIVGRDCSFWDWMTDVAAALAGVAPIQVWRLRALARADKSFG
jgi:VanZ family protein